MADKGPVTAVDENDIPGAALDLQKLTTYRKDELEFWLACRGDSLKKLPTKSSCIQRINSYVNNGRDKKIVDPTSNQAYTRGKVLREIKTNTSQCSSTNSCVKGDYWATGCGLGWKSNKDISKMPSLTIREIDQFFKTSGKTGKLHKRADALIYDSYLDNIECLNTNSFFYVRSICSASYSKNKLHKLSCAFDSSAQIVYSYCSCVAGKGGFCNHIYSLLKMLAQFVLDGLSEIRQKMACTSRPCGWTVPKVRKMNVQKPTVMETTIKKPRVQQQSKGIGCTLYEARAPEVQGFDQNTVMDMQNKLKETSSSIPIVYGLRNTTLDKSDWVQTKFGLFPVFSPLAYQCSRFGNNFKVYVNIDVNLPPAGCQPAASHTYPTFPHSPIPQYFEQDMSELLPSSQVTLQGLNVTALEAVQLEEATRSQSSSSLWHDERKKRVTASKVYEISQWKRCMENHADKYVNSSSSLSASNPFLQRKLTHGTMYEPVAWENTNFVCKMRV